MKIKILLALSSLLLSVAAARAQGTTAFTYQGRLNDGVNPANGSYDLKFSLCSTSTGSSQVANPVTNSATAVSNGLFTVTIDFGAGFPAGAFRWLEVAARTNGSGAFSTLTPRQQITPTPYAMTAMSAWTLTGLLPSASLSGTYSSQVHFTSGANSYNGSGANLTALNASQLTSGTVPDAELSANVALLNTNQTFSGANNFLGNVGIGTTSPVDILSVKGGALSFAHPSNPIPYVGMDYDSGSDALRLRANVSSASLNTTMLTVQRTTGNVGIGTTNPTARLHLSSNGGNSTPQAWINQENTSDYNRLRYTSGGDYNTRWDVAATTNVFDIYSGTFGRDFLNLSASGVSVGNNNFLVPGGNATIGGGVTVGDELVVGYSVLSSGYPQLTFGPSSGEGVGSDRISSGNQYGVDFYTQSIVRMSVTHAGNVGIGTATPTAKLDVNGTVHASGVISASGGLVIQTISGGDPVGATTGQIWLRTDLP